MGAPRRTTCIRGHLMSKTRKYHPNGDAYCCECKKIRYDKFRLNPINKEKIKKYRRKSIIKNIYGLTEKQYIDLLSSQNNCCAICKSSEASVRTFHVDHCHKTGLVRGLLCHYCNTAIGLLKEDVNILNNAITYLRSYTMLKKQKPGKKGMPAKKGKPAKKRGY